MNVRTEVIQTAQASFLSQVSEILSPHNSQGDSLLGYVRRTGQQLALSDVDVREVISEATTRGLRHIQNRQEAIHNPQAWLRKVCAYILYDLVKDEKRTRELKLKNTSSLDIGTPDSFSKIESEETRKALQVAFTQLSKEDQKILNLRFYEGMDYRDIQRYYFGKTGIEVKIPTLRQRESRALKRLRAKFQKTYMPSASEDGGAKN